MRKLIIWGAYPATLKAVRDGAVHIQGLGDGLLWWLTALVPRFAAEGYQVVWGDQANVSELASGDGKPVMLLLDLPHAGDPVTRRLFELVPPARRILLRLEPPAIAPLSYQGHTLAMFGALARVEPAPDDGSVKHVIDFIVPVERKFPALADAQERSGMCAVSAHKRIVGPRGQLYKLRETIYRQLSQRADFTLYGMDWNRYVSGIDRLDWLMRKLKIRLPALAPSGINYRGPIPDKADIIRHNFTLVIENHIGATYISEKPFDSLKYGVVPLYYGGVDLAAAGLADIVIQASSPQHIVELAKRLPPVLPREEVRQRYAAWLASPAAHRFSLEHCLNDLKRLFDAVSANDL